MAASQLPVESASGGQSTTASPQNSAAQASTGLAGQSTGIQQNTSSDLNTSGNGSVPLGGSALTSVNLNAATQSSQVSPATTITKPHQVSPVLLGLAVLLLVAAVGITVSFTRSAKNTTI